jgi:hypothetical protein
MFGLVTFIVFILKTMTYNMKKSAAFLVILTFFFLNSRLKAQITTEAWFDLGKNQVSKGLYSQFSNIGSFEKPKWGFETGYQLGLVQPQDVFFNSCYGSLYGKLKIRNIPLAIGGEYLWTAFSPDLRETNWMVFARTALNHWQFGIGTSNRTYRLSNKAANELQENGPQSRITEKWNIMYHATYLFKPDDNKWNLSFSIRNYDHFLIQQENNLMYNLRFDYKLSRPVSLYSEMWYKSAGLMVIKVTYFGMFLRMGLVWKI